MSNRLDKFFKRNLEHMDISPSAEDWSAMESLIDTQIGGANSGPASAGGSISLNFIVVSLCVALFSTGLAIEATQEPKDDKKITLDVKQETDKYVTITITDNGVGRAASKEIKEQKTLNRKSVGIALTKERLENFSKGFSDTYNIQIIDLHDKEGIPNGTEVVLNIPIRSMILESA